MWDELENALAWFKAAPANWVKSGKQDLSAAAEWIFIVLQGDFAEEQSTAQTITGTVISMIPFVDQICDVRDVVANCKKIHGDSSNKWTWVALVLTLIGLFPTLGSLAKGGLKILFAYSRKSALKLGAKAVDADYFKLLTPYVETGIHKFNDFLAMPATRKALTAMKIDNPYKWFAKQARELSAKINTATLTAAFDEVIKTLTKLTDLIKKWGTAGMNTQVGQLLRLVKEVRGQINAKLADLLKPVQHTVDKFARRLEVEADMNYRAYTNALNPHAFTKPSLDGEIAAFKKDKPGWVDVRTNGVNPELRMSPKIPDGYPDISDASKSPVLKGKFKTFHTIQEYEVKEGETIYRVLDPGSLDNSICWMSKAEFEKLKSKDDWRRRFAVWANWNTNGEVVTYTVPAGKSIKAWEGITGSQNIPKTDYWLEGGARQILIDPADLEKGIIGKRKPTGWGYSNFGEHTDMVGVPTLTNNWYESKK
jgi:hypothetical protein